MNKVAIAAMTALAIVAAGTQTAAAKADGMEPAQGATRDSRQTGAPDGGSGMKARKMSEEQREAMLLRTGGMIETPESGPWIAAVLEKGAVPDEMAEAEIAYLRKTVKVPVRVIEAEEGAAADAAKAELASGAAIALSVVSAPGEPSLSIYPSEQRGTLNFAALATDDASLLAERFHKEFLRCVAYTLGAGNSAGRCLLKPIRDMAGLDSIDMKGLGPEGLMAVMSATRERGMKMMRKVPYRRAVEEGWAPPPTNDLQRAVWDDERKRMAERAKAAE